MEVEENPSEPESGSEMEAESGGKALLELRRANTPIVEAPTFIVSLTPILLVELASSFPSSPLLDKIEGHYLRGHYI